MSYNKRITIWHRLFFTMFGVGALLAFCASPEPARAQSTALGGVIFAPDRAWSWVRRQYPPARTWDDGEEKSSIALATGTALLAAGVAKLTPMSYPTARRVFGFAMLGRSAYAVASGETRRYRAHAKHAIAISAVSFIRWDFRW